jgi:hypothetical protein
VRQCWESELAAETFCADAAVSRSEEDFVARRVTSTVRNLRTPRILVMCVPSHFAKTEAHIESTDANTNIA